MLILITSRYFILVCQFPFFLFLFSFSMLYFKENINYVIYKPGDTYLQLDFLNKYFRCKFVSVILNKSVLTYSSQMLSLIFCFQKRRILFEFPKEVLHFLQ